MATLMESLGVDKWDEQARYGLFEELRVEFEPEPEAESEEFIAELMRRCEEADRHPETLVDWEEFEAELLARPAKSA